MSHALLAVGNRPHFIKLAPIVAAFRAKGVSYQLMHTGQHTDAAMSEQFFAQLDLSAPNVTLLTSGQTHGAMTASILEKSEAAMLQNPPKAVLVFGDTNSTLAVALAAKKLGHWLGHVEAGPRLPGFGNPEEINRVLVDRIADANYSSDPISTENLRREGLGHTVVETGDVMFDAFLQFKDRALTIDGPAGRAKERFPQGFAFMTLHRAENVPLGDQAAASRLADFLVAAPYPILLAMHPRTRRALSEAGELARVTSAANVMAVDPTGYLETLQALQLCTFVVTDSGGLQKEAYFSQKRVAFLLPATPWVALVETGWVTCLGRIDQGVDWRAVLAVQEAEAPRPLDKTEFGVGEASQIIAAQFAKVLAT